MKLQPTNYNLQTSQKGFTLIEAVVATAIFAFVISSIVGVYISTIQLDRKTRALRAVSQNARFITEFLTKEVRNGAIDYTAYTGGTIPGNNVHLHVLNQAGDAEDIYPSANTCTNSAPCDLMITKNGSTVPLNSTQTVKITRMGYYISPVGDPYVSGGSYTEQPHVTMVMELSSTGQTFSDSAKVDIETTVSSRSYPAIP